MLQETYVHEMLARVAGQSDPHALAHQRALAELPRTPGPARQVARKSGWLLIRLGTWLFAYGGGRDGRMRLSDLQTYAQTTKFSQN